MEWTVERRRGYNVYRAGEFWIDRRFKWSYRGGGRTGSVQQFWLNRDDVETWGPFKTLKAAQAAAERKYNEQA